jgi:hypothetical protein
VKDNHITSRDDFQGVTGLHGFWQHDSALLIDNELHMWDYPTFSRSVHQKFSRTIDFYELPVSNPPADRGGIKLSCRLTAPLHFTLAKLKLLANNLDLLLEEFAMAACAFQK